MLMKLGKDIKERTHGNANFDDAPGCPGGMVIKDNLRKNQTIFKKNRNRSAAAVID
jgi:hypothetical protein